MHSTPILTDVRIIVFVTTRKPVIFRRYTAIFHFFFTLTSYHVSLSASNRFLVP